MQAPLPAFMSRKPKRKLNSYNFFFHHHRQLILDSRPENENRPKDSHGKVSFQDLAKLISARWRKATDEEKAYFKEMEREDQVRYDREMAARKKLCDTTGFAPVQPASTKNSNTKKHDRETSFQHAVSVKPLTRPKESINLPMKDTFSDKKYHNSSTFNLCDCIAPIFENTPFPEMSEIKADPIKELANKLGDEGVDLVIKFFL